MNSAAHPLKAGFNQSGGAYFMVMSNLEATPGTLGPFVNQLLTAGSNSGGAFTSATFSNVTMGTIIGGSVTAARAGGLVTAGSLLRDMGKTVVSSGRTFRKFAPIVNGNPSSFGVVGQAPAAPNAGYGAFYLEVGREGVGAPAPVVRYA
jgi:hypothetical protein